MSAIDGYQHAYKCSISKGSLHPWSTLPTICTIIVCLRMNSLIRRFFRTEGGCWESKWSSSSQIDSRFWSFGDPISFSNSVAIFVHQWLSDLSAENDYAWVYDVEGDAETIGYTKYAESKYVADDARIRGWCIHHTGDGAEDTEDAEDVERGANSREDTGENITRAQTTTKLIGLSFQ